MFFCGPQTHELAYQCMCLHLIPKELCLGVFQYNFGDQCFLRFTWVAPIYPTGVCHLLCTVLGFSGIFPYAITFSLVSLVILFQSWSRGACQRFLETDVAWAFPSVHHHLLVGGGSSPSPFGNDVGHCCNYVY
jgi:hypothetical protein